jgi:hypothetical protein
MQGKRHDWSHQHEPKKDCYLYYPHVCSPAKQLQQPLLDDNFRVLSVVNVQNTKRHCDVNMCTVPSRHVSLPAGTQLLLFGTAVSFCKVDVYFKVIRTNQIEIRTKNIPSTCHCGPEAGFVDARE